MGSFKISQSHLKEEERDEAESGFWNIFDVLKFVLEPDLERSTTCTSTCSTVLNGTYTSELKIVLDVQKTRLRRL